MEVLYIQSLLKNGFILTENGLIKSDILIENEKIKDIGNISLENFNGIIYDYSNKFIIPGGVDVHTHFNINVEIESVDDFYSGGIAAVYGGTTTIIDHPSFGPDKCSLDFQNNLPASVLHYHFHLSKLVQLYESHILKEVCILLLF